MSVTAQVLLVVVVVAAALVVARMLTRRLERELEEQDRRAREGEKGLRDAETQEDES